MKTAKIVAAKYVLSMFGLLDHNLLPSDVHRTINQFYTMCSTYAVFFQGILEIRSETSLIYIVTPFKLVYHKELSEDVCVLIVFYFPF